MCELFRKDLETSEYTAFSNASIIHNSTDSGVSDPMDRKSNPGSMTSLTESPKKSK